MRKLGVSCGYAIVIVAMRPLFNQFFLILERQRVVGAFNDSLELSVCILVTATEGKAPHQESTSLGA